MAAQSEAPRASLVAPRVLTIGHSTHPIDAFIRLLNDASTSRLVDVRTIARSRHNPQFEADALDESLREAGIDYLREPRLGGLRGRSREIPPEVNGFWDNQSFHRYADHALGEEFAAGLEHLISLAAPDAPPVIMCSEAVWWRCHRRIVADHLLARDIPVAHVMPDGRQTAATLTAGARVTPDGVVTYPG